MSNIRYGVFKEDFKMNDNGIIVMLMTFSHDIFNSKCQSA